MKPVLLLAFSLALFNTGLIWTIQIVHYPGFLKVSEESYQAYQSFHMKSITSLVGPSMLLELLFSVWALMFIKQLPAPGWHLTTILILALIWVHTALWASPLHMKLVAGYNEKLVHDLIQANWWRTIGWTLRAGILGLIVYRIIN